MRILSLVIFCLVFGSNSAHATSGRAYAQFVLENLSTSRELLLYGLAGTGASVDSLRIIKEELESAGPAPRMELRKNFLYINGQKTEVEVVGNARMGIRFKGQHWYYDKNQSIDQNYFALKKVLNSRKSSLLSIILNEAHAAGGAIGTSPAEKENKNLDPKFMVGAGAVLGAYAGGVGAWMLAGAVMMAAPPLFPPLIIGGIIGGLGMGAYTLWNQKKKEEISQAVIGRMARGDFSLVCDGEGVQSFMNKADDKSSFQFKHESFENSLKVTDAEGKDVPAGKIKAEQKQFLAGLKSCRTTEQAEAYKKQIQETATQTKAALESPTDAPTGGAKPVRSAT